MTSATLCDGIVASESATFSTPFHRLAIPPEGCSSVHFGTIMGEQAAARMLGPEGWCPTALEAFQAGFVAKVVPEEDLPSAAQAYAEAWVETGKGRTLIETGQVDTLKEVNDRESRELADAFLSDAFLEAQYQFLSSKGKTSPARVFWWLRATRPLWKLML